MNTRIYKQARAEAVRRLERQFPGQQFAESEVDEETDDVLLDWQQEAAVDREMLGEPEDTPSIQSADIWGTGEGRYHGLIG
ncbi:hypothetical protein [Burkholderia vietnamiensis]|uniref:hypothetical protein n=1 Tax=Burkholderia vietnamiensis TaxID=60552 RepID=UPI001592F455|nr:hypothetical protein [Burkholderia vietnamiensis]